MKKTVCLLVFLWTPSLLLARDGYLHSRSLEERYLSATTIMQVGNYFVESPMLVTPPNVVTHSKGLLTSYASAAPCNALPYNTSPKYSSFTKKSMDNFKPSVYLSSDTLHDALVKFIINLEIHKINSTLNVSCNRKLINQTFVNNLMLDLFAKEEGTKLFQQALVHLQQFELPFPDYNVWNSIISDIAMLPQNETCAHLNCAQYLSSTEKNNLLLQIFYIRNEEKKKKAAFDKVIASPKKSAAEPLAMPCSEDSDEFPDLLKMTHPYHPDHCELYGFYLLGWKSNGA